MSDPAEREHLQQLQTSPGWLLFVAYARQEWGSAEFTRKMKRAIADATANKEDPAQAVLRVNAAHDAVNDLLLYPRNRVGMLLNAEESRKREDSVSRRGAL